MASGRSGTSRSRLEVEVAKEILPSAVVISAYERLIYVFRLFALTPETPVPQKANSHKRPVSLPDKDEVR